MSIPAKLTGGLYPELPGMAPRPMPSNQETRPKMQDNSGDGDDNYCSTCGTSGHSFSSHEGLQLSASERQSELSRLAGMGGTDDGYDAMKDRHIEQGNDWNYSRPTRRR